MKLVLPTPPRTIPPTLLPLAFRCGELVVAEAVFNPLNGGTPYKLIGVVVTTELVLGKTPSAANNPAVGLQSKTKMPLVKLFVAIAAAATGLVRLAKFAGYWTM